MIETDSPLAQSNNAFAIELYAKVRAQEPGNLAVSPFSILVALAMTLNGASGATSAQMRRVLHLPDDGGAALVAAKAFMAGFSASVNPPVTLQSANGLFVDRGVVLDPFYVRRMTTVASLESLDFRQAASEARGRINAWAAEKTRNRIQNLIPPGGVDDETRLVLANAIYFLGDWARPFEKHETSVEPFRRPSEPADKVPTMHATAVYRFVDLDGAKLLELPYRGDGLAMTLILPERGVSLDAVEGQLVREGVLDVWLDRLARTRVHVSLPKFTVDPSSPLALRELLSSLGMPLAFDNDRADFAAMVKQPSRERLCLGNVFHKAFVKVDEKGTEAAAATAVVVVALRCASLAREEPAEEFKADHPFLFVLRDVRSGLILFMGRVTHPGAQEPEETGDARRLRLGGGTLTRTARRG